ncbi:hypothetical protein ACHAZ8_004837 [Klebsiella aerogenes]
MAKLALTREQAQKIIVAADEVITALAGTNEDVHPDDSKKMCELWDDLNDRYAPPVVVRELARMALAAMDSEPVAYTDEEELNFVNDMACMWTKGMGINEVPLYRHAQPAPVAPECHSMFDVVTSILDGIDRTELDDGWWETSAGAEFGREKLEEIRSCMIKKSADKSAFLQHAERLATDAKELAERVQRNDVKALTTSEEHRQLRDLVMMVKTLCRTVRKYNPESQQAANFTAYLQKEGLISVADCLRVSDPLDTESEDRRG